MAATSASRRLQRTQTLLLAVVLCAALNVHVAQSTRDLHNTPKSPARRDATDICDVGSRSGYTTECAANCLVCEAQGATRDQRRCVCCKAGYQVSLISTAACAACPVGSCKAEPGVTQKCINCAGKGMTTQLVQQRATVSAGAAAAALQCWLSSICRESIWQSYALMIGVCHALSV
jgi:hypothetical protein